MSDLIYIDPTTVPTRQKEQIAMARIADRRWRLCNLYKIKDKYGNVVDFEPNWAQLQLLKPHNLNLILKARQLGVCLAPETLVLKADLTWVKIGEMKPGDQIVSVDEQPPGNRKARRLRRGIVQGVVRFKRDCYRITFDNGKTLICTGQHPWLSRKSMPQWEWRSICEKGKRRLSVGSKIRRIVPDTWQIGDFEDGWMGGLLDGEGSLAKNKRLGGNIGVSQVEGEVFARALNYFKSNGYTYRIEIDKPARKSKYGKKPVNKIVISRIDEIFKLIGKTRPSRFINSDWWEGKELPGISGAGYSTIVNIEHIGEHEVVDLQTSVGTYIAEGYVSHNTTFFSILFLDTCLFNDHIQAAIIADAKPIAREIFVDKVKFAYDNLPDWVKQMTSAYRDNVNELRFSNGSAFRVGTSVRGNTLQLLHITEFAKTCVENPRKADEIMTGALNTLQAGQFACIESTARGKDGHFYEMCMNAIKLEKSGRALTAMDWKFWFFPWYQEPSYSLPSADIPISKELQMYFQSLEKDHGILLDLGQRNWYAKKHETQGDDMKREFPSTPEESFESANEGFYFAKLIARARHERRVCHIPPDPHVLKFSAWDIGWSDSTAIWTFQVVGKEIHFLDYYENSGESLEHYVKWLKTRPYDITKHFLPHDSAGRSAATGKAYVDYAREMGLKCEVLKIEHNKLVDIEMVRYMLNRCWFNTDGVEKGLKCLENYRKEWNDKLECYRERPLHNWASHGTDAFIYAINGVQKITGNSGLTPEQWKEIRSKYV